jgi:hypothetical protein
MIILLSRVAKADLFAAIRSRLERAVQQPVPDALAITLGQQTQQLSRQANERFPHRPDLPKTDPAADHESTQQRRLQP